MRKYTKLALLSITAMLLMAVAVSSASAGRLSTSNQNIRVTWRRLEFRAGESALARCAVTLEGSFHSRTITKTTNALLGYVTRAIVGPCSAGAATVLTATLPWHITYQSFAGTLPNITRVRILLVNASFLIEQFGFRCLARTTAASPASGEIALGAGGRAEGLKPDERVEIPTTSGGGFGCPSAAGNFATEAGDPGVVTLLGTSTSINVTLK
jgi:hypothetical protein